MFPERISSIYTHQLIKFLQITLRMTQNTISHMFKQGERKWVGGGYYFSSFEVSEITRESLFDGGITKKEKQKKENRPKNIRELYGST